MAINFEIEVIPEIPPGSPFFNPPQITISVDDFRASKNPMFKITGTNYAGPSFNSGGSVGIEITHLLEGTYDVFYKDDDISEKRLGRVYVIPLSENCYIDDDEVNSFSLRRLSDDKLVVVYGNSVMQTGKYQVSVDGGATFKNLPESGSSNSTEFPAIQSPELAELVIRRADFACSYSPIQDFITLQEQQPPTCTLEYDNPAFSRANETLPDGNNGEIRIRADQSTAQGTILYKLTKTDGQIIRDFDPDPVIENLSPGLYYLYIKDDVCDEIRYKDAVGVLAYVSEPQQSGPSRSRDYINNPNFTRFYFIYGMTLDDFQDLGGNLPDPIDEHIDIEEVENASVRITQDGDTRITTIGNRRVIEN